MSKIKIYSVGILLFFFSFTGGVSGQDTIITTSDSVELYVKLQGEGTPCLFIHGGPGQGSNYWEVLAGEVGEQKFKMVYLDQRGCGRSTSPIDTNYSIDRMIQDFEEVRQALGFDKWMIMGHSFGGILQTYYAIKYPEKVKGIMMFNCTLNMKESLEKSYIPAVVDFFGIQDNHYLNNKSVSLSKRLDSIQKLFAAKEDVWKLSFNSFESARQFGQTYAGFDKWNMDFSKAAFKINDYNKDFAQHSTSIKIPTLFLYGSDDHNVGVQHYKKAKFPNMMLVKIDAGHMAFIDNNAEYINAVKAFLDKYFPEQF